MKCMAGEEVLKFVYTDDNQTKVIKGYILEEDEFTYKVKTLRGNEVRIGKRTLVIANPLGHGDDKK